MNKREQFALPKLPANFCLQVINEGRRPTAVL